MCPGKLLYQRDSRSATTGWGFSHVAGEHLMSSQFMHMEWMLKRTREVWDIQHIEPGTVHTQGCGYPLHDLKFKTITKNLRLLLMFSSKEEIRNSVFVNAEPVRNWKVQILMQNPSTHIFWNMNIPGKVVKMNVVKIPFTQATSRSVLKWSYTVT